MRSSPRPEEIGIPRHDDINGARQEGAGYFRVSTSVYSTSPSIRIGNGWAWVVVPGSGPIFTHSSWASAATKLDLALVGVADDRERRPLMLKKRRASV